MVQRQISPNFLNSLVMCPHRDEVHTLVRETASETAVFRVDVLANVLGTEKSLRLKMFGDCFNQTGVDRTITFRWYFGSTTLATAAFTIPNNASKRAVKFEGTLMAQEELDVQRSVAEIIMGATGTTSGTSAAATAVHLCTHETVTEDSTVINEMLLSVELSASSVSLLFNFWGATLEVV